jgi:hypothetical protein
MGNQQFGPSIKMHERPSSFNQMEDVAARCILLHAPCNMEQALHCKLLAAKCKCNMLAAKCKCNMLVAKCKCNMLVAYPKVPEAAKSFNQVTLAVKSSIQIYIRACNTKNPSNF